LGLTRRREKRRREKTLRGRAMGAEGHGVSVETWGRTGTGGIGRLTKTIGVEKTRRSS